MHKILVTVIDAYRFPIDDDASWDTFRRADGPDIARVVESGELLPEDIVRLPIAVIDRGTRSLAAYVAQRSATIAVSIIVDQAKHVTNRSA